MVCLYRGTSISAPMPSVFLNTIGAPPPAKATKIEWKDCKVSFSNCWKANDGTESADYKA